MNTHAYTKKSPSEIHQRARISIPRYHLSLPFSRENRPFRVRHTTTQYPRAITGAPVTAYSHALSVPDSENVFRLARPYCLTPTDSSLKGIRTPTCFSSLPLICKYFTTLYFSCQYVLSLLSATPSAFQPVPANAAQRKTHDPKFRKRNESTVHSQW